MAALLSFLTLGLVLGGAPLDHQPGAHGGTVLAYGDGKADGQRSMAGSGHAILFEDPPEDFVLTCVELHGARYGGNYDPFLAAARVSLCDERMRSFAESCVAYEEWQHGRADWIEVHFTPTRVPARFYVVVEFFPTATKGVYLSIDDDTTGHSFSAVPGGAGLPLDEGDWMIRAMGRDRAPKVEQPDLDDGELLSRGDGEQTGKLSVAGNGHAVVFRRPSKLKIVTGAALYGQLYGGGYDPDRTYFQVFVCDKRLKVLSRSMHPYSLFSNEAFGWAELDLPPTAVPSDFAILVYFDPAATRGVYLGKWAEDKAASLLALPHKGAAKLDKGEGWMLRTRVCASRGKEAVPELSALVEEEGLSAVELAELAAQVDQAELEEDADEANRIIAELRAADPLEADRLGDFHLSPRFLLRERGMRAEQVEALLRLMESARSVLQDRFGVVELGPFPDKRVHLSVTLKEGMETQLFTNPRSEGFAQIVLTGPPSALAAPTRGGPHVVYGFCHELGHVLAAWEDSHHQWAHYVGSVLTSAVHMELGDAGWSDPYDYHQLEGMPRFLAELEADDPAAQEELEVSRLLRAAGQELGDRAFAAALAWIHDHREGTAFHSYRQFLLTDLRDAWLALGEDAEVVGRLFGGRE